MSLTDQYVRIDHYSLDIVVTQEVLSGRNVITILNDVGGKGRPGDAAQLRKTSRAASGRNCPLDRTDAPERQIDTGPVRTCFLVDPVLPMVLSLTFHQEQAARC